MLTFCDFPGKVEPTSSGSERRLRPCVVHQKVTNGYRALWAREAEADVWTIVDTARINSANLFAVIVEHGQGVRAKPPRIDIP